MDTTMQTRSALMLGATGGVGGDAMPGDDVIRAARGVRVVVHAVNPPGHRDWDRRVLPIIDNTIAAARAAGGARIVLPGTVYSFDPATTPVIREDGPQAPGARGRDPPLARGKAGGGGGRHARADPARRRLLQTTGARQ